MATLSVWKFTTPEGADDTLDTLQSLQKQELITIIDAATVSWPGAAKKPTTRQLHDTASAGALGGAFWGLLFGLIFFVPLIGAALGTAIGAASGALSDVGIDDDFIKQTREQITPGTSALFAMTTGAVVDKIRDALAGTHAELIHTNLSDEQENALRAAFA
jgi:uncharacterized membrane protein